MSSGVSLAMPIGALWRPAAVSPGSCGGSRRGRSCQSLGNERRVYLPLPLYPRGRRVQRHRAPRDQVLHFRHGLDPRNPRLGLSPIISVTREIWTDNESTDWVAGAAYATWRSLAS